MQGTNARSPSRELPNSRIGAAGISQEFAVRFIYRQEFDAVFVITLVAHRSRKPHVPAGEWNLHIQNFVYFQFLGSSQGCASLAEYLAETFDHLRSLAANHADADA